MKCPMTERAVLEEFHKRTSKRPDTRVMPSMIVQVKKKQGLTEEMSSTVIRRESTHGKMSTKK
jgi:hypothetical protein